MFAAHLARSSVLFAVSFGASYALAGTSGKPATIAVAASAAEAASGQNAPAVLSPLERRPVKQANVAAPPCANERDWVDAESGTPNVLLEMAQEALVVCEGKREAGK